MEHQTASVVQVRSNIVEFLQRELIGPDPRPGQKDPNAGEEILRPQDPPRLRYSAGVLFPGGSRVQQSELLTPQEAEAADTGPAEGDEPEDLTPSGGFSEADDATEHEVNRANEFLPSVMGITALVRPPKVLKITVTAGLYERKSCRNLGKRDKHGDWQPHHWCEPLAPNPLEVDCSALFQPKAMMSEFEVPSIVATLGWRA
jgi:hypothetical protein